MSDKKHAHLASEWVNAYSSQLLGFAISRVKDEHLAKDLVQETFVSAWKNIEQYNGGSFCKNLVNDHFKK